MLLSIGMIVKNEEKHLHNCLTSMLPILKNVKSELIIFDTGSTDATVEIARKFTKNVHQIEWRNDFAWARNHTLEKATGKWFMYVDADEVFTDTADLVAFFNSGEYKKYKCATYKWRNVHADGIFSHNRVSRLFKREKNTRFEGKIHECIMPHLPKKDLLASADHFGYYENTNKSSRNMPLLLEMHKEDPTDVRVIYHIVKELPTDTAHLNEAERFIKLAFDEVGEDQEDIYFHMFSYLLVLNFAGKNDSQGVIDTASKYLSGLKYTHQALLGLLHTKTIAHHRLGEYSKAAKTAEEAMEIYEKLRTGKLDLDISTLFVINENLLVDKPLYLSNILINHILAGNSEAAFSWAEVLGKEPGGNFEICGIAASAPEMAEANPQMTDAQKNTVREISAGLEQKYPLFSLRTCGQ